MMKPFLILLSFAFFSCSGKQDEKMVEKETEIIESYFTHHKFKNTKENFDKVNANLLGIKPDKLQNGYNNVLIFNEATNYQISKEGKYIKIGNDILPDLDNVKADIKSNKDYPYFEELLSLNKIIYQNDLISILSVASKNTDLAIDLVVLFNYEKNETLFNSAIRNIQNWDDIEQSSRLSFVFYNSTTNVFKIREKLLENLKSKDSFLYALTTYLADNKDNIIKKNGIPDSTLQKAIAYLLQLGFTGKENIDIQSDKTYLLLNNIYISHPELRDSFKKNKYYGYPSLEKYSKDYGLLQEDNQEKIYSRIVDPDGFTNLRKDKNTSSQILQKIKTGEQVEVLDQNGDWWLVVSKEGKKGYVHKSRIKSE
ncbi:SH3 domain-containing protein [Chryseobacterium sp. D764]|uniref:SH3 domain-containing protein n=1 Tax=Chryseobacterium sp. D764 TaxID=2856522 RepID=UPI001C588F91|nr:SH3 domain-containing protein [Chryseobacterium sp. D764]QXU49238.1 SH3 domain-containing protein [Chryseobacterium sp. D764]